VLLIVSLLLVSAFMGSTVVRLVAARRFPQLEAKRGAGWWHSMAWSVAATQRFQRGCCSLTPDRSFANSKSSSTNRFGSAFETELTNIHLK